MCVDKYPAQPRGLICNIQHAGLIHEMGASRSELIHDNNFRKDPNLTTKQARLLVCMPHKMTVQPSTRFRFAQVENPRLIDHVNMQEYSS